MHGGIDVAPQPRVHAAAEPAVLEVGVAVLVRVHVLGHVVDAELVSAGGVPGTNVVEHHVARGGSAVVVAWLPGPLIVVVVRGDPGTAARELVPGAVPDPAGCHGTAVVEVVPGAAQLQPAGLHDSSGVKPVPVAADVGPAGPWRAVFLVVAPLAGRAWTHPLYKMPGLLVKHVLKAVEGEPAVVDLARLRVNVVAATVDLRQSRCSGSVGICSGNDVVLNGARRAPPSSK